MSVLWQIGCCNDGGAQGVYQFDVNIDLSWSDRLLEGFVSPNSLVENTWGEGDPCGVKSRNLEQKQRSVQQLLLGVRK